MLTVFIIVAFIVIIVRCADQGEDQRENREAQHLEKAFDRKVADLERRVSNIERIQTDEDYILWREISRLN